MSRNTESGYCSKCGRLVAKGTGYGSVFNFLDPLRHASVAGEGRITCEDAGAVDLVNDHMERRENERRS